MRIFVWWSDPAAHRADQLSNEVHQSARQRLENDRYRLTLRQHRGAGRARDTALRTRAQSNGRGKWLHLAEPRWSWCTADSHPLPAADATREFFAEPVRRTRPAGVQLSGY